MDTCQERHLHHERNLQAITLWYIWKAKNDKLFHQKTWTTVHVHNAAVAHINTHTQAILPLASTTSIRAMATQSTPAPQGMQISNAGAAARDAAPTPSTDTLQVHSDQPGHSAHAPSGTATSLNQVHMMNKYRIAIPALLQGTSCYVDASTTPDQPVPQPRTAGLSVFILNSQAHPI
jgi:hypothetical protein